MTFLVLLLVLLLQRYINFIPHWHQPNWLATYFRWPLRIVRPTSSVNKVLVLILALLPIVLLLAVIEFILNNIWFEIFDFIFQFIIIWYCVDAYPLKKLANSFAEAKADVIPEQMIPVDFVRITSAAEHMSTRDFTEKLFIHAFHNVFAIWFWYIILGPVVAVIYFLLKVLHHYTTTDSTFAVLQDMTQQWLAVFDWIPVRITGLGYALMGHFVTGFNYCMRYIRAGLKYNEKFTINSGLAALYGDQFEVTAADATEPHEALALIDRSLWFWLVIVALFTLGGWL